MSGPARKPQRSLRKGMVPGPESNQRHADFQSSVLKDRAFPGISLTRLITAESKVLCFP